MADTTKNYLEALKFLANIITSSNISNLNQLPDYAAAYNLVSSTGLNATTLATLQQASTALNSAGITDYATLPAMVAAYTALNNAGIQNYEKLPEMLMDYTSLNSLGIDPSTVATLKANSDAYTALGDVSEIQAVKPFYDAFYNPLAALNITSPDALTAYASLCDTNSKIAEVFKEFNVTSVDEAHVLATYLTTIADSVHLPNTGETTPTTPDTGGSTPTVPDTGTTTPTVPTTPDTGAGANDTVLVPDTGVTPPPDVAPAGA